MSLRPVKQIIQPKPTIEGAGVKLQRAFGFGKTKDFDPFLLLDDFRNENPAGLPGGISLASAPRHRDHHLCARRLRRARRQPGQQRQDDRRRRAMDDCGQRHSAPGDAEGRSARPHARLSVVGEPACIAEDDRPALSGHSVRARFRRSPMMTAPACVSSAASSGAREDRSKASRLIRITSISRLPRASASG